MNCKFPISSSFGRKLRQKSERAGSEHYVQTHITEPHCLSYLGWSTRGNQFQLCLALLGIKTLVANNDRTIFTLHERTEGDMAPDPMVRKRS